MKLLKNFKIVFISFLILQFTVFSYFAYSAIQNKSIFETQGITIAKRCQLKGIELEKEGKIDQAIIEYKKSLEYCPEDTNTLFNLGGAYLQINKPIDALIVLQKLININPSDYEAFNLLGIAYSGTNNRKTAIILWKKSLVLNPNQPKVLEMIKEVE